MNIALVCDFFYPQPGGVEFHMYHLAQELINLGHSVVLITHVYNNRRGIRYLTNGLKVYYLPLFPFHRQTTMPTVFSAFPLLRQVFIREQIDIVHGHASLSSMANEAVLHANVMGLKTVLTDHSLYGFADTWSTWGNKILKNSAVATDRIICVSHTCKENIVLRGDLDPLLVSVIPNAVVSEDFTPREAGETLKRNKEITIVVISRLFPNKGADLLNRLVPIVCEMNPLVKFIIAGDGPKFIDIQQSIETHRLQDRVELMGGVKHEQVRDVMIKGDIYLQSSLTEAFGTVLVEAASCGLLVVTTRVGGTPEVLPENMTIFAQPSVTSLVKSVNKAIELIANNQVDTSSFHQQVKEMYDWKNVAVRTENVYKSIGPNEKLSHAELLKKFNSFGGMAGKLFVLCFIVDLYVLMVLEWFYPAESIELAAKWPREKREEVSE
jgi:phosphatidylinositol glycan class A protein